MSLTNTKNIRRAYIRNELLFGVLISLLSFSETDENYHNTILWSLFFDLSKIGVSFLFIQLFNFLIERNQLKDFVKTAFVWLNLLLVAAVALISYVVCLDFCIYIWERGVESFPGSKAISMMFLIAFYLIRIGLFSAFMFNFTLFIKRDQATNIILKL